MRQKVGIFQDSWAPCDHTHSEPLPLSLLSLLHFHPSFFCILLLAVLFPAWLPSGFLFLSLALLPPPSLPPPWYPAGALVRAAYRPDRHQGQRNAGASLSSTQQYQKKKNKNQQNRQRPTHTFSCLFWAAAACRHVRTLACARMWRKRLTSCRLM